MRWMRCPRRRTKMLWRWYMPNVALLFFVYLSAILAGHPHPSCKQDTFLAAARSRSGSDNRSGCHSLPSRRFATRREPRDSPLSGSRDIYAPQSRWGDSSPTMHWREILYRPCIPFRRRGRPPGRPAVAPPKMHRLFPRGDDPWAPIRERGGARSVTG